jgi:hypothetical protein
VRRLRDLHDAIFLHAMAASVILDQRGYGHVDREEPLWLYVGLTQPSECHTGTGGGGAPLNVLCAFCVPSGV